MTTVLDTLQIGLGHYQAGQLDDAEAICRTVLDSGSERAACLHLLRLIAFKRGEHGRAIDLIELSLKERPDDAEAHAHLGAALQNAGEAERAVEHLRRSLALKPEQPEAHRNLGLILRGLGKFHEAAEHQRQAIAQNPNYAEAHSALGVAMMDLGKPEEAVACFRRALALRPEDAEVHNNLGVLLMNQDKAEEAIARFEQAIALKRDYADPQVNYGAALMQQGRVDEAIERYRRALTLQPDHADGLLRIAGALGLQLETEAAVAHYRRALEAKPDLAGARIAMCQAQIPILYRDEAEIPVRRSAYRDCLTKLREDFDIGRVAGDLAGAIGSSQPFYLAYQGRNDRDLQRVYGELACCAVAKAFPEAPLPPPVPGERVRVGIVAGLFRHHTVWKLMIKGWLTQLDRSRFQVFGYHTAAPQDEWTGMARQLCDRFVQGPLTPAAWREEILADAPHVLLYPDVGMDPGAGHLAAHRLALVQCMSFGHPNTSGYPTIDYFLSSALMEPADADEHYTERLIRLPNLAFYYEPLAAKAVAVDRAAAGAEI